MSDNAMKRGSRNRFIHPLALTLIPVKHCSLSAIQSPLIREGQRSVSDPMRPRGNEGNLTIYAIGGRQDLNLV